MLLDRYGGDAGIVFFRTVMTVTQVYVAGQVLH